MHNNNPFDPYAATIRKYGAIEDALIDTIRRHFPEPSWRFVRSSPWFHVLGSDDRGLVQGWKIHVSATPLSALQVLQRVIPVLLQERCAFKIAETLKTLAVMNEAHYPRAHSGKFITIYPNDDEQFRRIAIGCDNATQGLQGPAVLSDRRLRSGSLVHYRYGAFRVISKRDDGEPLDVIRDPQGNLVPDKRNAWYAQPDWVTDPFEADRQADAGSAAGDCAYVFRQVIRHANKGGVYIGERLADGMKVLIKEARPHVHMDEFGHDAIDCLRNEARMLRHLADTGAVPKLIDVFAVRDHLFLAEEFLEGRVLKRYITDLFDDTAPEERLPLCRRVALSLTEKVKACLATGCRLRDLSSNNVMVVEGGDVRIIDLEIASMDEDARVMHPGFGTPGYFYPQRDLYKPAPRDDLYSLGCVSFFIFAGKAPYYMQDDTGYPDTRSDRDKMREELLVMEREGRFDSLTTQTILGLLADEPDADAVLEATIAAWSAERRAQDRVASCDDVPPTGDSCRRSYRDMAAYLADEAQFDRPAIWDRTSFGSTTSPINIMNGIAGVGLFLLDMAARGETQTPFVRQVVLTCAAGLDDERVHRKPDVYEGGEYSLYFGWYGTLWFLLDAAVFLQDDELRKRVVRQALELPVCSGLYDIVLGTSGYGMANLHFWSVTGDSAFLQRAELAAQHVLDRRTPTDTGVTWLFRHKPEPDQVLWGYAHGNAGISHFLLLMYRTTGNRAYLDAAVAGIDEVIGHAIVKGGSCSWNFGPDSKRNWDSWCNGTSGIGTALIRFYYVTKEQRYLTVADMAMNDVMERSRQGSLCQCHGLAGNAEFVLDLYRFTRDRRYLAAAENMARKLYAQRVCRLGKYVFADETGVKISSDYGTGATGVSAYMSRLESLRPRLLMNDDLLM